MIDRIAIVLRFQKAFDERACPATCQQIFDGEIFVSVRLDTLAGIQFGRPQGRWALFDSEPVTFH